MERKKRWQANDEKMPNLEKRYLVSLLKFYVPILALFI